MHNYNTGNSATTVSLALC